MSTETTSAPGPDRTDEPFHCVLVPLDGSDLSFEALRPAAAIAERFGVPVEAVTVTDGEGWFEAPGARAPLDATGVPLRVVAGADPAPAIVQHAEDPALDLVCMATHGHGRVLSAMVGSIAESVLRRSHRPLVAVGPGVRHARLDGTGAAPLSVPRLVACVDGSEASQEVLPTAAAWAEVLGMELTILLVAEPTPSPTVPLGTSSRGRHLTEAQAHDHVAQLVARWSAETAAEVTGVVALDPISAASGVQIHLGERPAGLLVVGTHARTGAKRLWSGSVAARIVHIAPIPVLVVPLT